MCGIKKDDDICGIAASVIRFVILSRWSIHSRLSRRCSDAACLIRPLLQFAP